MDSLAAAYEPSATRKSDCHLHERTVELCLQASRARARHHAHRDEQSGERLSTRGTAKDSARLLEKVVAAAWKAKNGDDDPATLAAQGNLAIAYEALGDRKRSLELHELVLKRSQATLGDDHADTLVRMNRVAAPLRAAGRYDEAIDLLADAYRRPRRARPRTRRHARGDERSGALPLRHRAFLTKPWNCTKGRCVRCTAHGDDHRMTLATMTTLPALLGPRPRSFGVAAAGRGLRDAGERLSDRNTPIP